MVRHEAMTREVTGAAGYMAAERAFLARLDELDGLGYVLLPGTFYVLSMDPWPGDTIQWSADLLSPDDPAAPEMRAALAERP